VKNCIQTSLSYVLGTQDARLKYRPAAAFRESIGVHHDYLRCVRTPVEGNDQNTTLGEKRAIECLCTLWYSTQIRFAPLVQNLKGKRFKPAPGLSLDLQPIVWLGSNTLPSGMEPSKKEVSFPKRVLRFWLYRGCDFHSLSEMEACEVVVGTQLFC
jgi:hypothetical protein